MENQKQMSPEETLRHSTAHVMATAVLRLWPDAQFSIGPPVDTGFYYDVDMEHRLSNSDLSLNAPSRRDEADSSSFGDFIPVQVLFL